MTSSKQTATNFFQSFTILAMATVRVKTAPCNPNGILFHWYIHVCFYKQHFISNTKLKFAKNQPNAKQHSQAELLLFENYSHSSSTLSSKNNGTYSKKEHVCLYSWDYTINRNENEDKMKNRWNRYDINRPRSRHGHKYSTFEKHLSMMMPLCTKQHLSNMSSLTHKKVNPLLPAGNKKVKHT